MVDESRFRYRRDEGAAQAGMRARPASTAADDGDPLAELARLIGQDDPFDDFSGLDRNQAPQAADPRRSPAAQRYAPPPRAPEPPRAPQPQPSGYYDDEDDDGADAWAPAPQPAPQRPAAAAPVRAESQSRAEPPRRPEPPRFAPPPAAPASRYADEDDDDGEEAWSPPPPPQRPAAVPARPEPQVRAEPPRYAPPPAPKAPAPASRYADDEDDDYDSPQAPQSYAPPAYAAPRGGAAAVPAAARVAPSPLAQPLARAPQVPAAPSAPVQPAVRQGYGSLARERPAQQPPASAQDDDDDYYDDAPSQRRADPYAAQQGQHGYGQPRGDARSGAAARRGDEDEAAYAYSAERRDDDYDDYDDTYDPEYADDGYMPPHGEEMYEAEPRRRKGRLALILGASAVGLVVAGVAGVFAYNMATGKGGITAAGTPPVIRADSAPAKTSSPTPAAPEGSQKMIYDRVGANAGSERMVTREEQPVDVTTAARASAPPPGADPAAPPAQTAQSLTEPKKVRTLTVRADGSVAQGIPTSAVSAYAANQNPLPAGLPEPNPVTTVPASGPGQTASTSPAPTAAGAYVVQVASQRSEADAMGSWRALQTKYPNLLGNYRATVKKADLGDKGIYYRAQVGPFATREQANELCQSLRSQGGDCVVNKN